MARPSGTAAATAASAEPAATERSAGASVRSGTRTPGGVAAHDLAELGTAHVNEILREHASELTTRALTTMEQQLDWFARLGADQRSWITLISRSGIDGLVQWLDERLAGAQGGFDVASVFRAAPSELTGEVSLHQTVDLMRVTIEVVEQSVDSFVPDRARVQTRLAIMAYSRELAFAAAEVYARAAEMRGAWDARLEALVVDSIVRAEEPETVMSRASAFGWDRNQPVCVLVGSANGSPGSVANLRRAASRQHLDCLVANQGDRIVAVLGSDELIDAAAGLAVAHALADHFGPGHVVVGPPVSSLGDAAASARAAISG